MDKPQAVVAPASSGNGTFRPYEGHRDTVVVHDMNVEASPNWLLKNSLPPDMDGFWYFLIDT